MFSHVMRSLDHRLEAIDQLERCAIGNRASVVLREEHHAACAGVCLSLQLLQ
jgi:hypothetical protein